MRKGGESTLLGKNGNQPKEEVNVFLFLRCHSYKKFVGGRSRWFGYFSEKSFAEAAENSNVLVRFGEKFCLFPLISTTSDLLRQMPINFQISTNHATKFPAFSIKYFQS